MRSSADVIRVAFTGMPYADGDEDELVETLRRENALSVSLVAELAGSVIGQITFSPATASDGSPDWYALGPLAVLPAHQRTGLGAKLVHAGLRAIEALHANGCILTGNPAYYTRFGFELAPSNTPPGEPTEFFMVKLLRGRAPAGTDLLPSGLPLRRLNSAAPLSGLDCIEHGMRNHQTHVVGRKSQQFVDGIGIARLEIPAIRSMKSACRSAAPSAVASPYQPHGSSSIFCSDARSCHTSPNTSTRPHISVPATPNVFGSAAPRRHIAHASPATRKRSRGTSSTSNGGFTMRA